MDNDKIHERGKQLAEDHAGWLFEVLRKTYVDAFVHGHGHGYEDAMREKEKVDV